MQQSSNATNYFIKHEAMDYPTIILDNLDGFITNVNQQNVKETMQKCRQFFKDIFRLFNLSLIKDVEEPNVLNKMSEIVTKARSIPTLGYELETCICKVMRECGGLLYLISNCDSNNDAVKFSSAKLLGQCLTSKNQAYVVEHGLEKVVRGVCGATRNLLSPEQSRIRTGILEHLLNHSEGTCEDIIRYGGLQAILDDCRKNDIETLRNCAKALVNLSLYGGAENQQAIIKHKVSLWLFPLAFHDDDVIKYYACLAIAILAANKEIEADVLKSGTLDLVESFLTNRDPCKFAKSNRSHIQSQSSEWLSKLIPILNSKRTEARNLAAFHFCLEASIREVEGNFGVFREIGAVAVLKNVAGDPDTIASKSAAGALKLMGERLPYKLIKQVPVWSLEDVQQWVSHVGFPEYAPIFGQNQVDGDLLLKIKDDTLQRDLKMTNGIHRKLFIRELHDLKKTADYGSTDPDDLNGFLKEINPEFAIYTYDMLSAGIDRESIKKVTGEQLQQECQIQNTIHINRILKGIKAKLDSENGIPVDVFLSYRRSDGKYLASLLKVKLELSGFEVFLDVDGLKSGKFDENLIRKIKAARNFVLVLTHQSLDRCIDDADCKDWVHREIITAKQFDRNIITVMSDDFVWPDANKLPQDLQDVCSFNTIKWNHDDQIGAIEELKKFLKCEVGPKLNENEGK